MATPFLDDAARDVFLSKPRLAILMTNRDNDAPIGVPVWFEWTGTLVRMFAANPSPKLRRIARDPRASVLVTNAVGEAEAWVAFDGRIEVNDTGAIELVSKLGARYWDLAKPELRETLSQWETDPDAFSLLTMKPERIRSGR